MQPDSIVTMSHEPTHQAGHILADRYEILDEIGRGGFGMVYRARQINMNREVAIKVLPPQFMAVTDVVERFKREAHLSSMLKHPNTITIHDYGQADDLLFIVMEFLKGEDLADLLHREGRLPLERIVRIATQILKSLAEAHDVGIVHRDLKPENIYLTNLAGEEDFVKVLDFGIAKLAQPSNETTDRRLTITGSTVGTPAYMSPEQAAGEEVDRQTDIYALGVILYEMACGHPPFHDKNPIKVMRAHLFEQVPLFPESNPLKGTSFEHVVMRALSKDKPLRHATAKELFRDLKEGYTPRVSGLPPELFASFGPPSSLPIADDAPTQESSEVNTSADTSNFDHVSRQHDTDEREIAPTTNPAHRSPDAIPFEEVLPSPREHVRHAALRTPENSSLSSLEKEGPPPSLTPESGRSSLLDGFGAPLNEAPHAASGSHEIDAPRIPTSPSITSSIVTVVDLPSEEDEVFVLTQPKGAESSHLLGVKGEAPLPRRTLTEESEPEPHPQRDRPSSSSQEEWSWDVTQSVIPVDAERSMTRSRRGRSGLVWLLILLALMVTGGLSGLAYLGKLPF